MDVSAFKNLNVEEVYKHLTPSDIVKTWNASAKNGSHDTHPRKPKPGSKIYAKLVQIYPAIFPSDLSSFPFITLMMVFYYVL